MKDNKTIEERRNIAKLLISWMPSNNRLNAGEVEELVNQFKFDSRKALSTKKDNQ